MAWNEIQGTWLDNRRLNGIKQGLNRHKNGI